MSVTKITKLPDFWLAEEERKIIFETLFTPEEKETLFQYQRSNQKLFVQSKIIIVDLIKPDGFLGDTIRDSRLTGVIRQYFPEKLVLERTTDCNLFGKNPFITEIRNDEEKVIIKYKDNQESPKKETSYFPKDIIKITSRFWGAFPAALLDKDFGDGITFHEMNLHHLHLSQIVWEILYNIENLASLPPASIQIASKDQRSAQNIFEKLRVKKDMRTIIIHPDAHNRHFMKKNWPVNQWIELIRILSCANYQIVLSTGINHPEVTQEIQEKSKDLNIPTALIPPLSLAEYTGVLKCFSPSNTVFVGLESMAASHLVPGLGLKSIVIGSDAVFNPLVFGPFGGIVVMSNDHETASVDPEKVFEAIQMLSP